MTAIKQTFDLINGLVEVSNLLVERVNGTAIHENGLLFINRLVKVTVNGQDAEFTKTVKLVPTTKLLDALNPAVYGLCTKEDEHSWFWFKDTRRYFPQDDELEIWIEADSPDEEIVVCIDNIKAAWSFEHCEQWVEFAKKYEIDVKLTGYDRGMMFSQIKTIFRNGKVKDQIKEYNSWMDWMWNCPQPNNGG